MLRPTVARDAAVQRLLNRLVATPGGPVGAIVTLYRNGRTTVVRAGRADAARSGAPRLGDHMRIASITKAFTGAVALHLVQEGRLGLDDTIGAAASRNDAGRLVEGDGARNAQPHQRIARLHAIGRLQEGGHRESARLRVADTDNRLGAQEELNFTPGSRYEYSNTDNIVVGLIAQQVTGRSFGRLLSKLVFRPAGLRQTTFPTRKISLPTPFMHGYEVEPGKPPRDVTTFLSPSGAWASGAIVSTPADLGAFIRADLGGRFSAARSAVSNCASSSAPRARPGPARTRRGLAIFRYQTRCGTVYGHTGNFPGYVQWAAATANGRRSVTTSLNIAAPTGGLLRQLRSLQAAAVCALLGR